MKPEIFNYLIDDNNRFDSWIVYSADINYDKTDDFIITYTLRDKDKNKYAGSGVLILQFSPSEPWRVNGHFQSPNNTIFLFNTFKKHVMYFYETDQKGKFIREHKYEFTNNQWSQL